MKIKYGRKKDQFTIYGEYHDNTELIEIVQVKVKITASHKGYFEFRLCPHNNPRVPVTQECLNRYLLHQPSGSTQFKELGRPQIYTVTLKLPQGVTCTQCVLQWKYNAGKYADFTTCSIYSDCNHYT